MRHYVYDETVYKGRPTVGFRSKWLIIFLFLKSFPFNQCCGSASLCCVFGCVVDPQHLVADPDPNSTYHLDKDPDLGLLFDAYPDPTFHPDADPGRDPSYQIKAQTLENLLK